MPREHRSWCAFDIHFAAVKQFPHIASIFNNLRAVFHLSISAARTLSPPRAHLHRQGVVWRHQRSADAKNKQKKSENNIEKNLTRKANSFCNLLSKTIQRHHSPEILRININNARRWGRKKVATYRRWIIGRYSKNFHHNHGISHLSQSSETEFVARRDTRGGRGGTWNSSHVVGPARSRVPKIIYLFQYLILL